MYKGGSPALRMIDVSSNGGFLRNNRRLIFKADSARLGYGKRDIEQSSSRLTVAAFCGHMESV